MDADLQHDQSILPDLISAVETNNSDLAIGTRVWGGDKVGLGFSLWRARASQFATKLAQLVLKNHVSDPMSGFFAIRRSTFESVAPFLTSSGFKILLDILASSGPGLRTVEVPYTFSKRQEGVSKFDLRAMMDFFGLVVNKGTRGIVPHRFALFACVGALGVFVHLFVLRTALGVTLNFETSQITATIFAMTSNFGLNNLLTYRDMKLHGPNLIVGLVKFYIVCGIGAVANVGFANWTFAHGQPWWIAGVAGVLLGSIFNYGMSSSFVWGARHKKPPHKITAHFESALSSPNPK